MALSLFTFAITQMQPVFLALGVIVAIDAVMGGLILQQVFDDPRVDFESEQSEQAYASLSSGQVSPRRFNVRLPQVIMENETGRKMFFRGWKFNMFNDMKQVNKAIAAVSVIFVMFFFSLSCLITQFLEQKNTSNQSLTLVIFTYSVICMFSYFNVAYVRDFDAIQVNFTPLLLTICGLVKLQNSYDFYMLGMVLSLLADSYCALRFSENHDQIAFSIVERFAMESWCQDAFNKRGLVMAQIVAVCLIFSQVYLNLVGAQNGEQLCFLFLGFYLIRLLQFLLKTSIAVNMFQSNFVCLVLAVTGVFALFSRTMSIMSALSCMILAFDALLGASMFVALNQEDIQAELGISSKTNKKINFALNCQGHITNLNMERVQEQSA